MMKCRRSAVLAALVLVALALAGCGPPRLASRTDLVRLDAGSAGRVAGAWAAAADNPDRAALREQWGTKAEQLPVRFFADWSVEVDAVVVLSFPSPDRLRAVVWQGGWPREALEVDGEWREGVFVLDRPTVMGWPPLLWAFDVGDFDELALLEDGRLCVAWDTGSVSIFVLIMPQVIGDGGYGQVDHHARVPMPEWPPTGPATQPEATPSTAPSPLTPGD